ncbi:hypothetical protein [Paenibacillus cremeus]|uniref:Uncharacterized protein n=1 Tax=Paenibacillus cremeus TaxID=2163881 RepID=A0A559KE32_9BACL|nr:hypothetical protein [Paenibacillus cremeus]TVY10397.1 hypothetical protein FPZ49_08345 [Paenibacillus cremeus]
MSAPVKTKLLIKHVIGRLLLDTEKSGCEFSLTSTEDGRWLMDVHGVESAIIEEIRTLQNELNCFYFEGEGASLRKWWLYDIGVPTLETDVSKARLQLTVNTRIGYSNENTQTSN